MLNQFNTDLQMFKDAYASGDWKTAGQAAGKITTDFAQLAGGVTAIAKLGVTLTTAGGRLLLNSVDDFTFSVKFSSIYSKAPAAKIEIDNIADEIAGLYNGTVAKAPIKSESRAIEKIVNDYGGDASLIKDLARNTIIVPEESIGAVAAELSSRGANVKIIKSIDDPLGYSGANISIKTNSGIFAEIQVNSPLMIYGKESEAIARSILGNPVYDSIAAKVKIDGGLGYKLYEQWRSLDSNSSAAKNLAQQSKDYYDSLRKAYGN